MSVHELPAAGPGASEGFHPVRKGYIRTILAVALILLGAAGIVLYSGWRQMSIEWALHGPLTAVPRMTGPALGSLFLTLAGLAALLMAALNALRSAEVRAHGLVLRGIGGARSIGWTQVTRLRAAVARRYLLGLIYIGTTCRYRLTLANGWSLRLDERYRDAERLGEQIAARVTPHQSRRALQAFHEGREIDFGQVRLQRDEGLRFGRHQIAWQEAISVRLAEGWLRLMLRDGRELKLAGEKIVNAGALLEVLGQIIPVIL